jgi:uncharacterized phage protein (TIGR01671 family)
MKTENIKFKAKCLDNGKWVEGSLLRSTAGIKERAYIVDSFSSMSDYSVIGVDISTVCQFTGLKDCKGNELYEHDVIKNYPFFPSEIVWSEELSGYYLTHANGKIYEKPLGYYLSLGKFIVVGNKFDEK